MPTINKPTPVDVNTPAPAPIGPLDRAPAPVDVGTPAPTPMGPPDRAPAPVNVGTPVVTPIGPPDQAPAPVAPGPGLGVSAGNPVPATLPVQEAAVDPNVGSVAVPDVVYIVPSYIQVLLSGNTVVQNASAIDFTGSGVTVTANGTVAIVTITSGGSTYGNSNVSTLLAGFGSNTISTTGNVSAGYLFGNGSQLTGITTTYGNSNVTALLASLGANTINGTGNITTTANISGGFILGNGSQLSGIVSSYGNANVVANLAALGSNPVSTTGNITSGNLNSPRLNNSGNVSVVAGGNTWTFGTNGDLKVPGPISGLGFSKLDFTTYGANSAYLTTTGDDTTALFMGVATAELYANTDVSIRANTGGTSQNWIFGQNGALTAPGNLNGVNVNTGIVSASGNVTGGNILTAGLISATGNVSGNFFVGNGSQLTGIVSSYGNANVVANLAALGSNPIVTTGNITAGNLIVTGIVVDNTANLDLRTTATNGNINLITAGTGIVATSAAVSAGGNVTGGNILTGGLISATGNITGNNFVGNIQGTTGDILNVGTTNLTVTNIFAPNPGNAINIGAGGNNNFVVSNVLVQVQNVPLSVAGNVTGGNILTGGLISATGNVSGNFILGNGSQLTGIVASLGSNIVNGNSNVSVAISNGNVTVTSNGTNTWTFDTTGNLVIPGTSGGLIKTVANGAIAIAAMNNGSDNPAQLVSWRTTQPNPDTIVSTYANSATIMTDVNGTAKTWTFGNTGNFSAPGNVSATGNVTAGNILTGGLISATGNVSGGNLNVTGNIVDSGALSIITGSNGNIALVPNGTGNVTVSSNISITGNTATITSANLQIGYLELPQISLSANVTANLTVSGKHYYTTSASNLSLTIANNSSVSWPVGTAISIVNRGTANVTIVPDSGVSLYLAGNSTSANRVVTTYGMATMMNVAANIWMINGTVV